MSDIPVLLPGETPGAGKLQLLGGLKQAYTPLLTASTTPPNLGADGTADGDWSQDGSMIDYRARFDFAGAGIAAGSGTYQISLPVPADPLWVPGPVGLATLADAAPTARQNRFVRLDTTTRLVIQDTGGGTVTNTVPWTWAAGDWILLIVRYRMAG